MKATATHTTQHSLLICVHFTAVASKQTAVCYHSITSSSQSSDICNDSTSVSDTV